MPAIKVEHLTKIFRTHQKEPGIAGAVKALFRPCVQEKMAVDDASFSIEPGELVGYIGVNGAGKSTTLKMLTGILEPTRGRVQVLGRNPCRERTANAMEIGVVFGQRTQLWWDLALIESLNLIAKIYDIDEIRYRQRLGEFTEMLELKDLLPVPVRNMSLGQKMRAELTAALIHDPRIVYLDEPTIGLDLIVKDRIREFIREQNRQAGTTVILTTHDLGDIETLCRRVIIIDAGKIIYDGPIETIKERFGKYRTITFETVKRVDGFRTPAGAEVDPAGQDEHKLVLRFDRTQTTASRVAAEVMDQVEVADFSLAEPDLSTIVRQIYGGGLDAREGS